MTEINLVKIRDYTTFLKKEIAEKWARNCGEVGKKLRRSGQEIAEKWAKHIFANSDYHYIHA